MIDRFTKDIPPQTWHAAGLFILAHMIFKIILLTRLFIDDASSLAALFAYRWGVSFLIGGVLMMFILRKIENLHIKGFVRIIGFWAAVMILLTGIPLSEGAFTPGIFSRIFEPLFVAGGAWTGFLVHKSLKKSR